MADRKDGVAAVPAILAGAGTAGALGWAADDDVVAVFQQGRPEALALVYERYGALVYTIALRPLVMRLMPRMSRSGATRSHSDPGTRSSITAARLPHTGDHAKQPRRSFRNDL